MGEGTRVKLHGRGARTGRDTTGSHVVERKARVLIEVLCSIPGPRHLCLEEGTRVSWLYEVLRRSMSLKASRGEALRG